MIKYVLCDTELACWAEVNPVTGLCDPSKPTPDRAYVRLVQYAIDGCNPTVLDLHTVAGMEGLSVIRNLVADGYHFVFHNAMFDLRWFRKLGIDIPLWEDTMIMSQIVNLGRGFRHSLDSTIERVCGKDPYTALIDPTVPLDASTVKKQLQLSDWSQIELEEAQLRYALADVGPEYNATFLSLYDEIHHPWFYRCYALEKKILPIVDKMRFDGLKFDMKVWRDYIAEKQCELDTLTANMVTFVDEWTQRLFPEKFMITLRRKKPAAGTQDKFSKKDGRLLRKGRQAQSIGTLAAVQPKPELTPLKKIHLNLYNLEQGDYRIGYIAREELGLDHGDTFKMTSAQQMRGFVDALLGVPSEEKLAFDKEDVKELIIVARQKGREDVAVFLEQHVAAAKLRKIVTTYGESYMATADAEGYIRSDIKTMATDTGRFSSSEPNIQNIPRDLQKTLFTCEPDEVIIWADYRAQEAALLLLVGNELEMYERFNNGLDLHCMSATAFGYKYEDLVTRNTETGLDEVRPEFKALRTKAKSITFSLPYGAKGKKLASIIGVTTTEGKKIVQNYWAVYPRLRKFMDTQFETALNKGYVSDVRFGRRRFFTLSEEDQEKIEQGVEYKYVFGKYQSVVQNFAIQSLGGTMLRYAMLFFDEAIKEAPDMGIKLRMVIHDSMLATCKREHAEAAGKLMTDAMERGSREVVAGIHIPAELKVIDKHQGANHG